MSTISNQTITQTVTLGAVYSYPTLTSPLTIAATGRIDAAGGYAIVEPESLSGTVVNQGTVSGAGGGILLNGGGRVTNTAGALIAGNAIGIGTNQYTAGVVNSGTISTNFEGVNLNVGGYAANTGGLIQAAYYGVFSRQGIGTVINTGIIEATSASHGIGVMFSGTYSGGSTLINSGTIGGALGTAVSFGGGGNLVVVNPGAVFDGVVNGGTGNDTLELGSTASVGTLSGLGTQYVGFSNVTVDAGARWVLSGSNTAGAGVTLGNAGTLTIAGTLSIAGTLNNSGSIAGTPTLSDGGYLDNTGRIAAAGVAVVGAASANAVVNSGTIVGTGAGGIGVDLLLVGTVVDAGTISGAGGTAVEFSGAGSNLLVLDPGYSLGGGKAVASGTGSELELGSAATSGTVAGIGTKLTGFGIVTVDAGARWTLNGGNTVAAGITLAGGVQLTNRGTLSVGGAVAVTGYTSPNTLVNSGSINGAGRFGALFSDGGSVNNSGFIEGGYIGVQIDGAAGTVTNSGTISGATSAYHGGVELFVGGTVVNNGTGSRIQAYGIGVYIGGGAGTVTNAGTIVGLGTTGVVVQLNDGGVLHNNGTRALIQGYTGVEIAGAAGSVVNAGTIAGGKGFGVVAKIGAAAAITNTGTISSAGNIAVRLEAGGNVANTGAGALIQGIGGVYLYGTGSSVTNSGRILATGSAGVYIYGSGGVAKNTGGLVQGANGVVIYTAGGMVTNSGTIAGTVGFGIFLPNGGTVVDSGTISGAGGTAIQFGGAGANLLMLDPGYHLTGVVQGSAGATNRVELAGTAAATFSGLGSRILGFATVTIAGIASWQIDVAAAALAGETITGNGKSRPLAITSAGTADLSGVSGFPLINLTNHGADTIALTNANFAGVAGALITVVGGSAGNTVVASGVKAADRLVMLGGAGADHFTGGAGNDVFKFSAATLNAGDTVAGGGGSDTLQVTTAGTISAGGVSGVATFQLAGGGANMLTLADGNFTGVAGATITVIGGNAGNTVDASAETAASDRAVMVGGAGADLFTGGPGGDTFKFTAAALTGGDAVVGGGGTDTLLLTTSGAVNATGVSGVETFTLAGTAADSLTLTNANFTGVTAATITVRGGAAGNTINAAGVTGSNKLAFIGGAGADIVKSGAVATMTGGGGNNQFVFTGIGTHTITDFAASAGNEIVLSNVGFNLNLGGASSTPQPLPADLFVANASGAFTSTSQRFAYNTMTGNLRYDPDGSGPTPAAGLVVSLTNHPTLAAGSLFFVS